MDWNHRTVFITGAGGFIGSHLAEELIALGARVHALVRYRSSGSWGWLDKSAVKDDIVVIQGDVQDVSSLKQAVQGTDVVFHLAALISIPYSYHAPLSYARTNVEGTLNLLQASLEAGVERVVHTSTSEVYGTARYVPIDENHPLQGQSPYSASKIGADKMAEAFHLSFGLPVTTVRPFNTYGPRQSARAIIPTIITQALTQPELRLGNLEPTRDLNFVEDTVNGFIRAAECQQAIGEVINIGTGQDISIGNLARTVLDLISMNKTVVNDQDRMRPDKSEVDRLCADNSKARSILDWSPRYSLREGLIQTIQWMEHNLEEYRPAVYAI